MNLVRSHVLICGGTGCTSSGSHKLMEHFERAIKENGLEEEVRVIRTGCFGLCEMGPVVVVYPEGAFYARVKDENVDEIVSEHLVKGRVVTSLLYHDKTTAHNAVTSLEKVDI